MHSEIFVTPFYTYVRKRIVGTDVIIQCPDWANWLAFDVNDYAETATPFFYSDKPRLISAKCSKDVTFYGSKYLEASSFMFLYYGSVNQADILQPLELEEI